MADRDPRVLRFSSAELTQDGDTCVANVELAHRERGEVSASTQGSCGPLDGLPVVAEAAAAAVLKAVGSEGDRMEIVGTEVQETFGARSVFVKVIVHYQGQRRDLMGFNLIEADAARSTVFALLSATNRFLGIG